MLKALIASYYSNIKKNNFDLHNQAKSIRIIEHVTLNIYTK